MSPFKIGLAVVGSLVALTASATAEVRYAGSPKLGYYIVPSAPPPAKSPTAGKSGAFDARAQLPVSRPPVRKGGIASRDI